MPQRRALFLDANRITAYAWQGGRIQSEGYFAGDVPGLEAFSAYLKTKRSSLFYLLADVAEEGYQIEDIPFVQGNDRKALIERRLSQYFYGTPLATAVSLGRDKTGRRDEKMLFSALTRPQFFEPWLATLRQSETRLAGVFSVPLILAPALCRPQQGHRPLPAAFAEQERPAPDLLPGWPASVLAPDPPCHQFNRRVSGCLCHRGHQDLSISRWSAPG